MPAPADPSLQRPVDEPPPVGRTWRRVYVFVIAALVVNIVLLYALTRAFS